MRIVIDAQVRTGEDGGIYQFLAGLVGGLAALEPEDEEYVVAGHWSQPDCLARYAGGDARFRFTGRPAPPHTTGSALKRALGPLRRPLGNAWRAMTGTAAMRAPREPVSDGFWETQHPVLVHQTYLPHYARTGLKVVTTIADLQHRHFPEFFSPEQIAWQEAVLPQVFAWSEAITAISHWVKEDTIQQYGVAGEKIFVIPNGPTTALYQPVTNATVRTVAEKFRLPDRFFLFPSLTYAHKNHTRLLEAIAMLRDRDGVRVNLVCTGKQALHWPQVAKKWGALQLQDQVWFLGYVSDTELKVLFQQAQGLVFPSLFEGAGIPVLEALVEGLPVVCSDIRALREYAGDAALYFDPLSVECIAEALRRVSEDEGLRGELRIRGRARGERYSWERSARMYRALYRKVSGGRLAERDEALLGEMMGAEGGFEIERGERSSKR
jgi:glycosyltransferase involved in cell wall biosynthesis